VFKLFGAKVLDGDGEGGGAPGEIRTTDNELRIATGQGDLSIDEVQPAGKARMPVAEWLRGRGRAETQASQRFT
jgi:methionyl-tRNA formyltransferase